ncbi:zinc ribbon domain-containing protein YjdM [Vagococcus elongatus]|uniref:Alkylphosphonate utilization protein n=1 Tax=Vagococcus elongatus TaxID=180344 RepID=A0A430AL52_9ENTE|nr:zinc ribbon domain-containing protein YjdM [Vagococcus elongatus]RSU08851.1 alkylphosphonate utilization protein [Vagococcus elongatus]
MTIPNCPECGSTYVYQDQALFICPECGFEFTESASETNEETIVKDANGNLLATGDTVTVVKDLKVKGGSGPIKKGTKIKNIRILDEPVNDHNVDGKVDGIGMLQLKSEFLKKI